MSEVYGFKVTLNTSPVAVATSTAAGQVDLDKITQTATDTATTVATSVATSTVKAALAATSVASSTQGAGWLTLSKNSLLPAGTRPGTMIVRTA